MVTHQDYLGIHLLLVDRWLLFKSYKVLLNVKTQNSHINALGSYNLLFLNQIIFIGDLIV